MAVSGPAPELLIELLSSAARTPGGQVGLLTAAQVAQVLGHRREWVYARVGVLGGFRLPGTDEWRFSPRGVAIGVFAIDDSPPMVPGDTAAQHAPITRRLAYPPARHVLSDRPRRQSASRHGASDGPPDPRDR